MIGYRDREEAGQRLGGLLKERLGERGAVVLGLPRGGVVVAAGVARELGAPLDVISVRKLGAPGQPELALGAVAEGGVVLINRDLARRMGVSEGYLEQEASRQLRVVRERAAIFRGGRDPISVEGRDAVVVDDGIATGSTAEAALLAVGERRPAWTVLAVPVASSRALERLEHAADEIVCPMPEERLEAVGFYYEDFAPTTDEQVMEIMERYGP